MSPNSRRRTLVAMLAGVVALTFGVFGTPALAGPGDQACEGPAAEHNPNCEDGQLVTPVCDTPAGDHNPFCEDGDGPPPENPPDDTPGGDNGENGEDGEDGCPPAGDVTGVVVEIADGFEDGGGPSEIADVLRAVACGVHDATGL